MLLGTIGCTACVIFLCALTAEFLGTDNIAGLRAAVFFIFFCTYPTLKLQLQHPAYTRQICTYPVLTLPLQAPIPTSV